MAVGYPSPLTGWREAVMCAVVVMASALTAVVTPYGAGVPRAWFTIMSLGDLSQYVEEHAPPSFSDPGTWPVLAVAGVYLFLLAGVRERPRVTWLLPLFWLFQASARVRHAPLFAVVTMVVVAGIWPATVWARRLATRRPDLYDPTAAGGGTGRGWVIPAVVVLLAAALQATGARVPLVGAGWVRLDSQRWPVEVLDAVRAHGTQGGPRPRVFCECEFGGFLIYHAPEYRVFFDDRFELYGAEMLREFVRAGAEGTAERMEEWQSRYGRFDAALVRPGGGFDGYFRGRPDEWAVVTESGAARFYVRRG
jgi:hypothetical protein